MATGGGAKNLRRGNMDAQAAKEADWIARGLDPEAGKKGAAGGGALRKGWPAPNPEYLKAYEESQRALLSSIIADPDAGLEEIHFSLTSLTRKLLRKADRSGQPPSKQIMDAVKEFRQTMEAVNEARRARGAVAEAKQFLETLDARMAEAQARLGSDPTPAAPVPA